MAGLKSIFDPSSVAIIGATDREGSIGKILTENLKQSKNRKLSAINPSKESVFDIPCYPTILSVPEKVDLAVIAVPAVSVPVTVEECGRAGVQGVVIVSSGFRETGTDGRLLEDQIDDIRKKYSLRVVGPNCLGFIRPSLNLNTTLLKAMPEPGKIAFISHSGALGSAILDWAMEAHIGFSMFASLGSMLDVDFGDLIDFLGDDPETKSIMIYMESVGHAKKFMSAARGFARTKPIVVLKPGRFGESANHSHVYTGGLFGSGEDRVYDAAFKRAGVVRVEGIDELFNCAGVLDSKNLPAGPNLAIITNSGGPGAITTDWLLALGGNLAALTEESYAALDAVLPDYWSHGNPIDVLGDSNEDRYVKALTTCLRDRNVDGTLVIYTPQGPAEPESLAKAIAAVARQAPKPVITTFMGGRTVAKPRQVFIRDSIPTYETPEEAVKTYLYMYKYERNLELLYETPAELSLNQSPPKNSLRHLIRSICQEGRVHLDEEESKRFLRAYKIPAVGVRVVHNVDEAAAMAMQVGYPVALKVLSADLSNRTAAGGVALSVSSLAELRERFHDILASVAKNAPQTQVTGVAVQRMITTVDHEIVLGSRTDRDFGAYILFGLGGQTAEIFKDVAIGLPPLNQTLARRLLEETKITQVLSGGQKKTVDLRQLEKIIVSFSNLVADFPEIKEIDLDPLAISGGEIMALDARITVRESCLDQVSPYPHLVITPYPSRYITPYTLSDGEAVLLRPIRPEDEPLEFEMLSTLSPETVRGRFFQSIKNISHEELTRFCNIDYEREMAFVAELRQGATRRIVGVSRIIMESDFGAGEFAVLVHDDFQNKSLGYKLIDMLIGVAEEKRLRTIYGVVLSDNYRMLTICRRSGFTIESAVDGLNRVQLALG
jgi:acetyltransferase